MPRSTLVWARLRQAIRRRIRHRRVSSPQGVLGVTLFPSPGWRRWAGEIGRQSREVCRSERRPAASVEVIRFRQQAGPDGFGESGSRTLRRFAVDHEGIRRVRFLAAHRKRAQQTRPCPWAKFHPSLDRDLPKRDAVISDIHRQRRRGGVVAGQPAATGSVSRNGHS